MKKDPNPKLQYPVGLTLAVDFGNCLRFGAWDLELRAERVYIHIEDKEGFWWAKFT